MPPTHAKVHDKPGAAPGGTLGAARTRAGPPRARRLAQHTKVRRTHGGSLTASRGTRVPPR
ncbi:hypothetical protein GCM10010349_37370 [Streptomyces flavofungini]|nr:hypothetical protein GCM10010349_37370 [Streptomyces flavofungini]